MIKITLPTGEIVEGDDSKEVKEFIDLIKFGNKFPNLITPISLHAPKVLKVGSKGQIRNDIAAGKRALRLIKKEAKLTKKNKSTKHKENSFDYARWTGKEIYIVAENQNKYLEDLALKLPGRTVTAIKGIRDQLKHDKLTKFRQKAYDEYRGHRKD